MSRIEQHIVKAWANRLAATAVKEVIGELQARKAVLSGDSGLKNIWEEICVQVQGEESCDWSAYVELIDKLFYDRVDGLDRDAQLALWAVTEEGWDYIYDHHADAEGVAGVPLNTGDIVSKLAGEVLSAAADYESPSLYRYLWGEDDPQYDEDEDYEVDEDTDGESDDDDQVVNPAMDSPADAQGQARIITPAGEAWDSWFDGEGATADHMDDREQAADQDREAH